MVRINKEEIKGITDDRKNSSCAATADNDAAKIEEASGCSGCDGGECFIEWPADD